MGSLGKIGIQTMKKIIVLLIMILILNCTSQKADCENKTESTNIKVCIRYLEAVLLLPNSYSSLFPIALTTCLQTVKNKKECNQKSEYLPSTD